MAIHVVFPGAGVGKRFGGKLPKQYLNIAGKPLMAWTLEAFQSLSFIDQYIIALSSNDSVGAELIQSFPKVTPVIGGTQRAHSVLNALNYLLDIAAPDDWVLVHDIARPCVSSDDIDALVQHCLRTGQGGVLAHQMTDTIKQIQGDQLLTLDRDCLWAVQTPQCFPLKSLQHALTECLRKNLEVTDESSAMEQLGCSVAMVPGSKQNIKLTHPEDQPLLEFYLTQKSESDT